MRKLFFRLRVILAAPAGLFFVVLMRTEEVKEYLGEVVECLKKGEML